MRTTRLIAVLVGLAAVAVFTTEASAMYHAGMGCFMSRDPGAGGANRIGAGGAPAATGRFIPRDPTPDNQYADGMNLYQYVRSNPVRWQDASGLQVMICTRPAAWWALGGKHAYLWDTTSNQSCGQSSSSGKRGSTHNGYPDGDEPGPAGKGHTCHPVPDSTGKEECAMDWCKKHMNDGIWFPFINDCHTKVQKALKACCLSDKGVPHPRF